MLVADTCSKGLQSALLGGGARHVEHPGHLTATLASVPYLSPHSQDPGISPHQEDLKASLCIMTQSTASRPSVSSQVRKPKFLSRD